MKSRITLVCSIISAVGIMSLCAYIVVVVLTEPKLDNGDLSFAVEVTDGDLAPSGGPVSLFIDMIGRPMTATSVAGVRRRGRRRARRRVV